MVVAERSAFAQLLNDLHSECGRPKLSALAQEAKRSDGFSLSEKTISDWLNGKSLPRSFESLENLLSVYEKRLRTARNQEGVRINREVWRREYSKARVARTGKVATDPGGHGQKSKPTHQSAIEISHSPHKLDVIAKVTLLQICTNAWKRSPLSHIRNRLTFYLVALLTSSVIVASVAIPSNPARRHSVSKEEPVIVGSLYSSSQQSCPIWHLDKTAQAVDDAQISFNELSVIGATRVLLPESVQVIVSNNSKFAVYLTAVSVRIVKRQTPKKSGIDMVGPSCMSPEWARAFKFRNASFDGEVPVATWLLNLDKDPVVPEASSGPRPPKDGDAFLYKMLPNSPRGLIFQLQTRLDVQFYIDVSWVAADRSKGIFHLGQKMHPFHVSPRNGSPLYYNGIPKINKLFRLKYDPPYLG
jgi:hypothetical protein